MARDETVRMDDVEWTELASSTIFASPSPESHSLTNNGPLYGCKHPSNLLAKVADALLVQEM